MKVLFLTNHYLDENSGGSFASRAYINAFAEISDTCLLLYPYRGKDITPFIHKNCISKGIDYRKSNLRKFIDIYRGSINRYENIALTYINEFRPDLVIFDKSLSSLNLIKKVKSFGIKIITIHHNYEMEYYYGSKPSFLYRMPVKFFIKKAERDSVLLSDVNLTLTEQDIELLKSNYNVNTRFYCLGVFESSDNSTVQLLSERNDVITCSITGNLSAKQTNDSLLNFLETIFPNIDKNFPAIRFIIAGRSPSAELKKVCLNYSNISLIENPVDINSLIANTHLYICPTNVGGGFKLRVMDGLRLGLPILTHSVSARGYDELQRFSWFKVYNSQEDFYLKFSEIISSIKTNKISNKEIQTEFYNIFSYNKGVDKLKEIINECFSFKK